MIRYINTAFKEIRSKAFLKRKRSRQDERVVIVTLTDTGKELRNVAVHIPCRLAEASGPIFDVEETRQLRMFLNKLLEAIDNASAKTVREHDKANLIQLLICIFCNLEI